MANRPKTTILDVADKAGVSKSTVSLVLQGSGLIRPATAEKVRRAMDEAGYVYNRGAANLRSARSNVIGMVINDLTNPFYSELAVAIERVCQSAGIVPFLANTAENPVRQEEVLKSLMEQGIAGLIVSPARGTAPDAFRRIEAASIPVVFVMRRLPESRIPAVVPDNWRGARIAAESLIEKGHRRLVFLGGFPGTSVYHERVGGFREACERRGIAPEAIAVIAGEANRRGGIACQEAALKDECAPTAAVCFNDAVAFGAMVALRRRGLEPGRDFAVVGFDDVIEAEHSMPALTSVAVDTAGLGERAAQMVLKMIQSNSTRSEDHIGAVDLVVRESCGRARSKELGSAA